MHVLLRKIFLSGAAVLFLFTFASAHNLPMGGSRWCFGKDKIVANIDLSPSLLAEIKEIKAGHYDLDSSSDEQLQQIATDILQPYINKRLSLSVGSKTYPVKVTRMVRSGNIYTIWLTIENISFNDPVNQVRIGYTLLFEETNNTHVNLAYGYLSDATGDALQSVFDFTPPAFQTTIDFKAPVWEVTIPGTITNFGLNDRSDAKNISVHQKDIATGASASRKASVTPARAQGGRSPDNNGTVLRQAIDGKGKKESGGPASSGRKRVWVSIGQFVLLGIEHILTGYDHIAFLLALIVIGLSIREVLKIITAFTVAHSITLLLAALQIVSLNARLVESVIAFSICYVALENLFKNKADYRWLITFGFGLVHGFGFASVLQELIAGKANLLVSVVSFNIGVELGQVMIFLVMLPVLSFLKNKIEFRKVTIATSLAIFLLGFTWLIERGFNMKFLPI